MAKTGGKNTSCGIDEKRHPQDKSFFVASAHAAHWPKKITSFFARLQLIDNQHRAKRFAKPSILAPKTQHFGSQYAAYCNAKPSILQSDMHAIAF